MKTALTIIALLAASIAWAHGPSRQKVVETVNIKASPDAVWSKLKDFNGMPTWHPAVAGSSATNGNSEGSVRTLKLKAGGELVETLETYNDAEKKISYRAKDGGALPVSNYASTIQVKPGEGGGSVVEWRGSFYRAYPKNDPPPGQDDEAAIKAITDVYKGGLANLKAVAEK